MPTESTAGDIPRPEHPRPDFMRQPWINLNGKWRFTFDPHNAGEQKRWHRVPYPATAAPVSGMAFSSMYSLTIPDPFGDDIIVPFPWESPLSTIANTEYKGAAWYQRSIEIPADWAEKDAESGPRDAQGLPGAGDTATATTAPGANVRWRLQPFLCFGAVDWSAKVWVDGRFVGEHVGGYTPFELDLSRYVRPGQPATLTVRVWDACDADTLLGKQVDEWYTHSGGIWQTVWLEGRPAAHITQIHVTPDIEKGEALFAVSVAGTEGKYRVTITSPEGQFPEARLDVLGPKTVLVKVSVPDARLWSPEEPHLYDCQVRLTTEAGTADRIVTYFGLRSIGRGFWDSKEYEYVLLNGRPVYLRGALDQAFHPEGLHAYPSDDAIRFDIQTAKDLGLNMLRCHIKVNDPRYYYWADRLGLLIMYDLPSASLYTPTARGHWEATFRAALARDFSHPAIFAWILFNETWGLEEHQTPASWNWVNEMFNLAKELDPTRLVEDNSACLYDHVKTDLNTWHFYIATYERARRHVERVVGKTYEGSMFNYVAHRYGHVTDSAHYKQGTEPFLNSEYGGLGAEGGDKDISYTFKFLTGELRRHPKICGYVYTELTDIEWEHNGLLNYDRTAKEFGYEAFFPEMTAADLNGADFVGMDAPPCQTVAPGTVVSLPVFISHWDHRPLNEALLCWRTTLTDRFGKQKVIDEGRHPIQARPYDVTDAGRIQVRCPEEHGLLTVAFWLETADGQVRARNYINLDVYTGQPLEPVERTDDAYALRFSPGDFEDTSRPNPLIGPGGHKFVCGEAGWVEYCLNLPEGMDRKSVKGVRLLFEAGARSAQARLGWKRTWRTLGTSYPQTEALKLPADLTVSLNGIAIGTVHLPDDPADARGVLSAHLHENFEYASYGFLIDLQVEKDTVQRILAARPEDDIMVRFEVPRTGKSTGLNLYGARAGAYPLDPTLLLELE